MALPNTFAAQTSSTGTQLDQNYAALGALTPIPCTISGTNSLALTLNTNTPTVAALSNYMQFTGIAANTNSGAVTAAIGSLSPLNVYKDTPAGPVVLAGGEIVQNCAVVLMYDSTLNTGSGGFHLRTGGALLIGQSITMAALRLGAGAFMTHMVSALATVTFTVIPANTSQDQTATVSGVSLTDLINVTPPSLTSGLVVSAFVPAAGTVTVRYGNITASSIAAPGAQTVRITGMGFT